MSRLPEDLDRLLHDLRGPLNAIAMHAEVLKRAVRDDPMAVDSVKTIQQELDRLAGMLAAAAEVIAIERRESRRVNLRGVVERALVEEAIKDLTIEDGPWPDVIGDPRLLTRAVAHLVQNAVEATHAAGPDTPSPTLRTHVTDDEMAAIVVRDFGTGLRSTSAKVLVRLGETTKPGHRGLGLLTVERIVRLHDGALQFASPGNGAEITLLLPLPPAA
jgi:signal transduction histidine kinase